MKTRKVHNTESIWDSFYDDGRPAFCAVDSGYSCVGGDTSCKEELGANAVGYKATKFVVILPTRLDDSQVNNVLSYINEKEKEVNVKATTIERVEHKENWLLISHSHRWSRNSVAHSILTTWVRYAVSREVPDFGETLHTDEIHLSSCFWLLDIVKKKSLRVFGTKQHTKYDIGMVSFMYRLSSGNLYDGGEPMRDDYDTYGEWDDAYQFWEESSYESDDEDFRIGDMDGVIPTGDNAYTKLVKMHEESKK